MTIANEIEIDGGVLVGHDGSAFSDRALGWALRLASGLGTDVTAVRSWVLTTAPRPKTWSPGYMPPLEDFEAAAQDALERDVQATHANHPDVTLRCQAVHGRPASRLVEASGRADLLVVGRRGHGGFKGLVLGSVSEQVVRHAACTVVVVGAGGADDSTPEATLEVDQGLDPEQTPA